MYINIGVEITQLCNVNVYTYIFFNSFKNFKIFCKGKVDVMVRIKLRIHCSQHLLIEYQDIISMYNQIDIS